MAYDVHITERALSDIDAAVEWIKERSQQKPSSWYDGLLDAILSLDEFPARCQVVVESVDIGREIRQHLYGKRPNVYRIFFEIRGETVYVLRIRHGAQAPLGAEDFLNGESEADNGD